MFENPTPGCSHWSESYCRKISEKNENIQKRKSIKYQPTYKILKNPITLRNPEIRNYSATNPKPNKELPNLKPIIIDQIYPETPQSDLKPTETQKLKSIKYQPTYKNLKNFNSDT